MILDPIIWLVHYMLRMQSLISQSKASVQWQAHKAATRHDMAFFNSEHSGQIAGRIRQLADSVQAAAELLASRFPIGLVRFLGSTVLVGFLAPVFLAPVAIWLFLNGLFAVWLVPQFASQTQKIAETSSIANGFITEYFANIRTIKIAFAYDTENSLVLEAIKKQTSNDLEVRNLTTFTGLIIRLLNTGLIVSIAFLGIFGLSEQTITAGEFVAGIALAGGIAADAGWFVAIWEGFTNILGVIRDARETIDPRPLLIDNGEQEVTFRSAPLIELKNVSFAYHSTHPILTDLNLTIMPGQKIGIVGPSGAGKSTIVNLLLRLYDTSSGQIYMNGENIKTMSLKKLRQSFAVVSQGDGLFRRSIKGNIGFGVENPTMSEITTAAAMANAANFIRAMNHKESFGGYDSVVGERGIKLSGGQQQRIMLARAFLQKRPVLILDEATSALDSNNEGMILQAVASYAGNTTVIAMAHRLATVKDFDLIVVMNRGVIAARGTHEELLASSSLYQSMWEKQAHTSL